MIVALATAYLAAGVLLALVLSRREDTGDWSWRVWVAVVLSWPALLLAGVAGWARPGLAALEVRLLTWVVGAATRRLARLGCRFTVE